MSGKQPELSPEQKLAELLKSPEELRQDTIDKPLNGDLSIPPDEIVQAVRVAEDDSLREHAAQMRHPILDDTTPFGIWLRSQLKRQDRVGGLARVAVKDPFWPGGESRQKVVDYFMSMGARDFVRATVNIAWDEFDKLEKRARSKTKSRARNAQRKATRRSQRR